MKGGREKEAAQSRVLKNGFKMGIWVDFVYMPALIRRSTGLF